MAERYAVVDGNWSDVATWDGGASLPAAADVVRANSYVVTIDQDVEVAELRINASGPSVQGGYFEVDSDGKTITADVYMTTGANGTVYFSSAGHTLNVIGDLYIQSVGQGSFPHTAHPAIRIGSTGTLNLTGSILHVSSTHYGCCGISSSNAASIINVIGDVNGGAYEGGGTNGYIYGINSLGTITVTGDVIGGNLEFNNFGIQGNGDITVTGDVTAGIESPAISHNAGGGTLTVVGDVTASTLIEAIQCVNTCEITGTVTAVPARNAISGPAYITGSLVSAADGTVPVDGDVLIDSSSTVIWIARDESLDAITLTTAGSDQPAITDVRLGVDYAGATLTGTLAVPDAQYVSQGVSVDSGVGTLDNLDASGIRAAIGLSSANLDTQLSTINSAVTNGVTVTGVNSNAVDEIFSAYTISESYASTGVDATPAQIMYMTQQAFTDFNIAGTTINVNKIGSGIAATYSLNDASTPTSRERST